MARTKQTNCTVAKKQPKKGLAGKKDITMLPGGSGSEEEEHKKEESVIDIESESSSGSESESNSESEFEDEEIEGEDVIDPAELLSFYNIVPLLKRNKSEKTQGYLKRQAKIGEYFEYLFMNKDINWDDCWVKHELYMKQELGKLSLCMIGKVQADKYRTIYNGKRISMELSGCLE
eukprot:6839_1